MADKHQIQCGKIEWARIGELANRLGLSKAALLLQAFEEKAERERFNTSLSDVAKSNPLSTGDMMLAHMVIAYGYEDAARVTMRATSDEWAAARDSIPGLKAEFDRRWPQKVTA